MRCAIVGRESPVDLARSARVLGSPSRSSWKSAPACEKSVVREVVIGLIHSVKHIA